MLLSMGQCTQRLSLLWNTSRQCDAEPQCEVEGEWITLKKGLFPNNHRLALHYDTDTMFHGNCLLCIITVCYSEITDSGMQWLTNQMIQMIHVIKCINKSHKDLNHETSLNMFSNYVFHNHNIWIHSVDHWPLREKLPVHSYCHLNKLVNQSYTTFYRRLLVHQAEIK